jgi:K+-transporting ATPase KdpF subunit
MTALYWIGLVVAALLFLYLFVAMLKPESMS